MVGWHRWLNGLEFEQTWEIVKVREAWYAAVHGVARVRQNFSSVTQSCLTLWGPMDHSIPGLPVHPNSHTLLKLISIESVMPSNHLILSHPLLLLPSIFPSIRVLSNESVLCIRWPKYWSFSFNISPSNEFQDWFPLGLTSWISLQSKRLLRVFSNTTVQKHQFFATHFLYSPTLTSIHDYWKNHSLRWTFVGKVMSLLFNMLSRLVITFLPRSKGFF